MEDGVAKVKEVRRHLPHDLIADHILTRLPIKPLLQFKSVSKQWYATLSSYQFAQFYHKLSLFSRSPSPTQYLFLRNGNNHYLLTHDDDDEDDDDDIGTPTSDGNKKLFEFRNNFHDQDDDFVMIGSCNGLVCFASFCGHFFILWNPITGISHKYSDPDVPFDNARSFRASWGFGYVSDVDDFKVIRILNLPGTAEIMVHVFSLKSNRWTRIADQLYQDVLVFCPCSFCSQPYYFNIFFETLISKQGVLVNETLYWIVTKLEGPAIIVAFDLVSEVFDANIGLDLVNTDESDDKFICNMGGCLSKFRHNMGDNSSIQMLKGPGKVESIYLSKDFPVSCCRDLVGFTGTGKFFIQLGDSVVGIVDPNSEPMKYTQLVNFEDGPNWNKLLANFVPSLTFPYAV